MTIELKDKCVKSRQGKYVVYDIDWLLDHLASEIALLWNAKQRDVMAFDQKGWEHWQLVEGHQEEYGFECLDRPEKGE